MELVVNRQLTGAMGSNVSMDEDEERSPVRGGPSRTTSAKRAVDPLYVSEPPTRRNSESRSRLSRSTLRSSLRSTSLAPSGLRKSRANALGERAL